jgi:uncharacterized oxidoreductase
MELSGKRVLVTGATSGIGEALVAQLAAAGATVIGVGRDDGRLQRAEASHPCVSTVRADLACCDQRIALAAAVIAGGGVDVVINNAGTQTEVDALAPAEWPRLARELEVNLAAPIHLVHLLLPSLAARGSIRDPSVIVNVTSGLALAPKAAAAPYCATKAGLRSYTKALRWQIREQAVRVVEALPPLVRTPMTAGRHDGAISPDECAMAIVAGLTAEKEEIYVGKSKLLRRVMRVAPSVGERKMRSA